MDGLERRTVVSGGARVVGWVGGAGPVVLLLHGYPQTSYMWRKVVPALLAHRTVVAVDLRGYGESGPVSGSAAQWGDERYAKRAMAADAVAFLDDVGVETCDVVGHDRGGRVGHRLALDHAGRVRTLTVLDIVPTLHMFDHVDRAMAEAYFHWFFLSRPDRVAEALIRADPASWVRSRFEGRHAGTPADATAVAHYLRAFLRPGVVEATCADYRAAATVDLEHDRVDRNAGRTVAAPVLAGWGASSYVGRHFDVADVWASYAREVSAAPIDADHFVAEENPRSLIEALDNFWRSVA